MADVRECLSDNGFTDVETWIQSGNVKVASAVTEAAEVAEALEKALAARFGFEVPTIVRSPESLPALVARVDGIPDPLPGEPRRYVVFFRDEPSAAATEALESWDGPHERVQVLGREALLCLTIGAGETKLTNVRLERLAGTQSTTRDLKVVRTLAERWGAL